MSNTTLTVPGLAPLWDQHVNGVKTHPGTVYQLVLDVLELGFAETVQFLRQERPTLEAFETWVAQRCGEHLDEALCDKIERGIATMLENEHPPYPLDLQAQTPVFTPQERAFWEENGYIVLKNAVPREDCEALEKAMWEHLQMSATEPEQWDRRNGTFWIDDLHHPIWKKNRESPRIRRAFAELWGTETLFMSLSRLSFNPPQLQECYHYGPCNLHWDISIHQPIPFDLLGVLYLNDVSEEQGPFHCVPGFHRRISQWLDALPEGSDPREAALSLSSVQVPGKAGDLIICRQELPHGSGINRGDYPRFAQYISMYPADRGVNPVWR